MMKFRRLIFRSLLHYWRTNIPVVAGVSVAAAVLSGALMVGRSVRGSLEDLLFERIGQTETVIAADRFFDERVFEAFSRSGKACPVIYLQGMVIREKGG
jgi:putative ABC transport system permease protein